METLSGHFVADILYNQYLIWRFILNRDFEIKSLSLAWISYGQKTGSIILTYRQTENAAAAAAHCSQKVSAWSSPLLVHILCLMGTQCGVTNRSWASSQSTKGHESDIKKEFSPGMMLQGRWNKGQHWCSQRIQERIKNENIILLT